MNKVIFNGFTLHYHLSMNFFINEEKKQIVFVSKDHDEIHCVLELHPDGKIMIHPRWNVQFLIEGKEVTIRVNYAE